MQLALGELAIVLPIPRTLVGVPSVWMPSYARMFIPDVIREETALWIDSDAILVSRADRLWDVDPGTVNVSRDLHHEMYRMVGPQNWERFAAVFPEISPGDVGFNAGVFALRPADWTDLVPKFEAVLSQMNYLEPVFFADQLMLNGIFRTAARYLPREYNAHGLLEPSIGLPRGVRVIHYASPPKPWEPAYPHATWPMYYWEKYALEFGWGRLARRVLQIQLAYPRYFARRCVRKIRSLAGYPT